MSRAGERNKLITLEQLPNDNDVATDEGELEETIGFAVEVWAGIEPLTSHEQWVADNNQATTSHTIAILYRDDVTTRWRAVWNGRTFNFDSVKNLEEKNIELEILATEVTEGN